MSQVLQIYTYWFVLYEQMKAVPFFLEHGAVPLFCTQIWL